MLRAGLFDGVGVQRPSSIPRNSFAKAHVLPKAPPFGISDSILFPAVGGLSKGSDRKSAGRGIVTRPFLAASRDARGKCHAEVNSPIRSDDPLNRFLRFSISSDVFFPPDSSMDASGTPNRTRMSRDVSAGSTPDALMDSIRWPVQMNFVVGCWW